MHRLRRKHADKTQIRYVYLIYVTLKQVYYLAQLSVIIGFGFNVNDELPFDYYTTLDTVVMKRADPAVVQFLVSNGVNVNYDGFALVYAAQHDLLGILKVLLKAGARKGIGSVLEFARIKGQTDIVNVIQETLLQIK